MHRLRTGTVVPASRESAGSVWQVFMLQYLAQGACQAIEDAVVFSDSLTTADADWSAALQNYAEARVERTSRVQRTARVWGEMWHVDGVAATLRDEVFRKRAPGDVEYAAWLWGDAA